MQEWRADKVTLPDQATFDEIRSVARLANTEGFGTIKVFGAVLGELDIGTAVYDDVKGDQLSVTLEKASSPDFFYFLSESGFAAEIALDVVGTGPCVIWVAADFRPFETFSSLISPWNGPRVRANPVEPPERPRKLVRDLTGLRTPEDIGPWLLISAPSASSPVYSAWTRVASSRLAAALPSEIRRNGGSEEVVLKGPRSAPIPCANPSGTELEALFPLLNDAAHWIYPVRREAETKFQFLNNHLSIAWQEGRTWPAGAAGVLISSLASAKEAYAFYLQDQSKDALKTLGDLRKALQEEVAKAQTATRDLLTSLWRDVAIAGVVLALKSPTFSQISASEVLRWVTLGTAILLSLSLVVTIVSNARFNGIADKGRRDWRARLYAFMSEEDWQNLVEQPIGKGRRTYHWVLYPVVLFYLAAIYYLLLVGIPLFTTSTIDPIILWCWQTALGLLARGQELALVAWTYVRSFIGS